MVQVPECGSDVQFMTEWVRPRGVDSGGQGEKGESQDEEEGEGGGEVDIDGVVEYMKASYTGVEVKVLPERLRFVRWDDAGGQQEKASQSKKAATAKSKRGKSKSRNAATPDVPEIALLHPPTSTLTHIRTRPRPSSAPFPYQLNLDDLLDAAIAFLPGDAYALVLLTAHDMYESEDDEFCAGRAYGGSRVAVVQTARYNPVLDGLNGIGGGGKEAVGEHVWPASHCAEFVRRVCEEQDIDVDDDEEERSKKRTRAAKAVSPMHLALSALISAPSSPDVSLSRVWTSRIALTAVHELGHCFGIAHCVYYACGMQGSASMAEEARQPPYVCPVELAKLSWALVVEGKSGGEEDRRAWVRERHEALRRYCREWEDVRVWRAYGGWLDGLLKMI